MLHRLARHRLAAAFALVTVTVSGCASKTSESENPDVGSATVTSALSSSSHSSPPIPPHTPPPPTPPAPTQAPAPTPPPLALPPFIASATWSDSAHGVTLRVAPTPSALRAGGPEDAETAWDEVLNLAPDADTPGMREQFDCHWTWARLLEPDKPTWNLEPWRPVVPAETMLLERCNPGGPEV